MVNVKGAISLSVLVACLYVNPSELLAETSPSRGNVVQAAEPSQPEPLLVEVFFNKRSAGDHICYKFQDDYWLPFALFEEKTNIKDYGTAKNGSITYQTTLGKLTYNPGTQKLIEQTPFISFSQLEKSFYVRGRFVQSVFAFALDVPWAPGTFSKKRKAAPSVTPDIRAPSNSLSFLSFEPEITYDFNGEYSKELLFEAGGRIVGGVWDISFEGDPQEHYPPVRYHWTTYNNKTAFRIGTGSSDLYSLVGSLDFTGIQLGWNNHSILNQLDFERYSDSDVFLSFDRSEQRTIEGRAPPASIAELRIDNTVVARRRIGLNGRFVFRNVRMTSDLRKTQVYIYGRTLQEKPLAILDYSMSITNRSMPAHELLVRTGIGTTNNPLDTEDSEPASLTGFGHVIYGLSNRITLESAIQYNPETQDKEIVAGTVFSIGGNWSAALYGARVNNRYGADVRVEGNGKNWTLSYLGNFNEKGFTRDSQEMERNHMVRFSTDILYPFDLLLYGKHNREGDLSPDKYLLPGAYWYVFPQLMLSAIPNDDKKYRYEANIRAVPQSDLTISYENSIAEAELGYDFSNSFSSRALYSHAVETGDNVSSIYFDWYPRGNRYDLLRFGFSRSSDQTGFSAAWNKFINTGLQLSLQYSYNMNNALQLDTEENFSNLTIPDARQYIALALTWDIGRSNKRFYPINRTAISHTRGGLAGSLKIMNETTRLKSSDINDVNILLNRRKLGQRQIDGSFFVGNLKPGVYAVEVDAENLPLELNVPKKTIHAEVLNGAVTEVVIPVHTEYSIAGRITRNDGNGVESRKVVVTDENGAVASFAFTNMFGYYRTDGLQPGDYTVSVSDMQQKVTIQDDYIYGINFTIQEPAIAVEAQEENEVQEVKTDDETLDESDTKEENEQQ